jgi:hypothetical protein
VRVFSIAVRRTSEFITSTYLHPQTYTNQPIDKAGLIVAQVSLNVTWLGLMMSCSSINATFVTYQTQSVVGTNMILSDGFH